jgi:hypothetical protein
MKAYQNAEWVSYAKNQTKNPSPNQTKSAKPLEG